MREEGRWLFTKYDILTRPVLTGFYEPATTYTREQMQQNINDSVNNTDYYFYEYYISTDITNLHGYSNQAFPQAGQCDVLTVTYYDDYDFLPDITYEYINDQEYTKHTPYYHNTGRITGTKTRMLDYTECRFLMDVIYYDRYGRVIQQQQENHLEGKDVVHTEYTFIGDIVNQKHVHTTNIGGTQVTHTIKKKYEYDHARRFKILHYQLDDHPHVDMVSNKYNELGELIEKTLHIEEGTDTAWQSIDYQYNIRGWLTRINQSNLDNDNYFMRIDELPPDMRVTSLIIDTINFLLTERMYENEDRYFLKEITDAKTLLLEEIDNPSNTDEMDADEESIEEKPESVFEPEEFEALQGIDEDLLVFDFDGLEINQDKDVQFIKDTIFTLVSDQMYNMGITDELVIELVGDMVKSYIVQRVGIIYFNEDSEDLFGMDILYQEGFEELDADEQYNGNISGLRWQVKGSQSPQRGYGFVYDDLNRITKGNYGKLGSIWSDDDEKFSLYGISYDRNGNIMTLSRHGVTSFSGGTYDYGTMDSLTYLYEDAGNRLTAVNDVIAGFTFDNNDFSDGTANASHEYLYDKNGNMVKDANKGIDTILYNYMNLPKEITFIDDNAVLLGTISYLYDALGNKLSSTIEIAGQEYKTDYVGNYVYTDDALDFVMTEEGRIRMITGGKIQYEYFLKDHLGSVRAVITDTDDDNIAEVVQEDHYYPFGLTMGAISQVNGIPENKFKYNGKELYDDFGLEWYDYGARFYDAQLGRFHTLDPLAENYSFQSPFVYGANNPIRFTDFFGMNPDDKIKKTTSTITNKTTNDETGKTTVKETTINTGPTSTEVTKNEDGTTTTAKTTPYEVVKSTTEINSAGEIVSNSATSYTRESVQVTHQNKDGKFISGHGEDKVITKDKPVEGGFVGNKTEALALGIIFDSKINKRLKRDLINAIGSQKATDPAGPAHQPNQSGRSYPHRPNGIYSRGDSMLRTRKYYNGPKLDSASADFKKIYKLRK